MTDDLTEAEEERWCSKQRDNVIAYLTREGIKSPNVGDWPAWHIAPLVSIWAIESLSKPGWVGWWAISGDLPTDYTPCGPQRHPREGLRDIALRWQTGTSIILEGGAPEERRVGNGASDAELAPFQAARAEMLLSFVSDDDLWED